MLNPRWLRFLRHLFNRRFIGTFRGTLVRRDFLYLTVARLCPHGFFF
jgi:hypothetical protein